MKAGHRNWRNGACEMAAARAEQLAAGVRKRPVWLCYFHSWLFSQQLWLSNG